MDRDGTARAGGRRMMKLLAMTLLLPLGFAAIGVWEAQRMAEDLPAARAEIVSLEEAAQQLHALAAKSPRATVRLGGRSYVVPLAASMMDQRVEDVRSVLAVTELRATLPPWVIGTGALAALLGALGLVAAVVLGRLGRGSRQLLLSGFGLVRRLLPLQMAAQILLITASALLVLGFEAAGLWHAGRLTQGDMKLMGAAAVLGGGALILVFQALRQLRQALRLFTPEPLESFGRRLDEAAAPGLWARLRELARRTGTSVPDHVVVGLTEGFFVTSGDLRLQPSGELLQGRTLYVPLPHLAMLDAEETGAIIGHELGHFSGEDTEYSRRFVPIYAGVERSLAAVAGSEGDSRINMMFTRPALTLGLFFMQQFDHAVHHWSRRREFAADAAGAGATSASAAASALLRSSAVYPRIHEALLAASQPPTRPDRDLLAEILEGAAERGLEDPTRHLEDRQPHPTDTHPPDSQRIAALGESVTPKLLARATRPAGPADAAGLAASFADPAAVSRALSEDFLKSVAQQDQARAAALQEAAAAVTDAQRLFYPNTRAGGRIFMVIGVLGLLAGLGCGALLLGLHGSTPVDPIVGVAGAVLGPLGLVALIAGVVFLRRARQPFLLLTPDGFGHPDGLAMIAWRDLADLSINLSQGGLRTDFLIRPARPLPARLGRGYKLRSQNGLRVVSIRSAGVAGLKPEAYADLVVTYWRAADARDELAKREALLAQAAADAAAAAAIEARAAEGQAAAESEPDADATLQPMATPPRG